jgi:hypothetical protein
MRAGMRAGTLLTQTGAVAVIDYQLQHMYLHAHTQGGFMLCRPNMTAFTALVAVVQEGDWSFEGWRKSGIGYVWGGTTIQVIQFVLPSKSLSVENALSHCVCKCRALLLKIAASLCNFTRSAVSAHTEKSACASCQRASCTQSTHSLLVLMHEQGLTHTRTYITVLCTAITRAC